MPAEALSYPTESAPEKEQESERKNQTPETLRLGCKALIKTFCRGFEIEGYDFVTQALRLKPEQKFVVTASHFSNLDAPAAIATMGKTLIFRWRLSLACCIPYNVV